MSSGRVRLSLRDLLAGVEVISTRGDTSVEILDLVHDSRRVRPGACFACVIGTHTDGHLHAPAAVAAGATALAGVEQSGQLDQCEGVTA